MPRGRMQCGMAQGLACLALLSCGARTSIELGVADQERSDGGVTPSEAGATDAPATLTPDAAPDSAPVDATTSVESGIGFDAGVGIEAGPSCVACAADQTCVPTNGKGSCVHITAPRPLAPLSTATVSSQKPFLSFILGDNDDGAQVDICRDRACNSRVISFDTIGSGGEPPNPLAAGVYFWRLHGTSLGVVGSDTSPVWEFVVGARSAPVDVAWGSWGTMLDINGDGLADVAVGDPIIGGTAGAVRVYPGSAFGLPDSPVTIAAPPGADSTFGATVASAGDVNGDGFADLLVGAPGEFDAGGSDFVISGNAYTMQPFAGAVYVYLGGPSGLSSMPTLLAGPGSGNSVFGDSVASAGDLNEDGYGDIVVGAHDVAFGVGAAYVYLGGPNGISTTPITIQSPVGQLGDFGRSVAGGFDATGDGLADVLVVGANQILIYPGTAGGVLPSPTLTLAPPTSNGIESVASAGDVNGDGYADIVAGATFGFGTNAAFVYLGGPNGVFTTPVVLTVPNASAYSVFAAMGDVNGDGFSDIAVSSALPFEGEPIVPAAYVFLGGASGPTGAISLATPSHSGFAVGIPGDVNGDGYADLVVGGQPAAYVFQGATSGVSATPATLAAPSATDTYFGVAGVE